MLRFEEPDADTLETAGGKGANLSRLARLGFPVPPGFIVVADAYRGFLASGGDVFRGIEASRAAGGAAFRECCARIGEALAARPVPHPVAAAVEAALATFPPGTAFAVRSSSTMEDLAGAAFAGQHETYLNCKGAAEVLRRLRDCWISLWSERAVEYRARRGFDHAGAAMAVVVQEMVPCESAGVAFSVDPVSGDLDTLVVDANFGLGESVVSGEGDVDHFAVDRATRSIRDARIARKTQRVVASKSGTREIRIAGAEAEVPALTGAQVGEVAELVLKVEAVYRFPQDVEWGFAKGRLRLLQSRPITSIPPRWTRDESAERFPDAITPLTWDFVEGGFHRSLVHSFRLMGLPAFDGRWFALHDHYVYGNQNAVELYARRAPLALRTLDEVRAALPDLRVRFRWVQDLPVEWARDLDHYLVRIGEFQGCALDRLELGGLWRFVLDVNEHGAQYFLPNIAISLTQGMLHRGLHGLLAAVVGAEEAAPLFDDLLAWCETKTGAINRELHELARLVRDDPALARAIEEAGSRDFLAGGGGERFPSFGGRFRRFLRDHGHREVEFDPYAAPWGEAPWIALDSVRVILRSRSERSPVEMEREARIRARTAETALFRRVPEDLHFFFSEILRLARAYTGLDDLEHYQTTRLALPLRRGLRELGGRLRARGVVAEPMDVFFTRWKDLDEAVKADDAGRWQALADAIRAEKAAWLRDRARSPAWVLGEVAAEPAGGEALSGIPGSPGTAEGPVFRVLGPDDFARFPSGAVLVARTTNPTWTPLFFSAAAVITESGGPLSHGAVTAREASIPAVMAVKDCLSRLENGRRVRVDGTAGRVHLL